MLHVHVNMKLTIPHHKFDQYKCYDLYFYRISQKFVKRLNVIFMLYIVRIIFEQTEAKVVHGFHVRYRPLLCLLAA